MANWLTYIRPAYGGFFEFTCMDFEPVPKDFWGARSRPATQEEIERETTNRSEKVDVMSNRPEWQDVEVLRRFLSTVELDESLIGRPTPEEWRALRIKLVGE